MSLRMLNACLLICLCASSAVAEPPSRGKTFPKSSGEPAEKLSDEQELILASSTMRREVRDYLKKELKVRELPEYKLNKSKALDVQVLADYTAANGDRQKLLTLIAGHLQTAGEPIQTAYVTQTKTPDDLTPEVLKQAREALAACKFAAGTAFRLGDKKLAAGIAEGWILPYAGLGHVDPTQSPSQFDLARVSCNYLARAEAWEKLDRAARIALDYAPNQNSADAIRLYQVQSLMAQKKSVDALEVLAKIQHPSYAQSVETLRPQLMQQAAEKPADSKPTESGANP